MTKLVWVFAFAAVLIAVSPAHAADAGRFEQLLTAEWREVFHDPGTGDWKKRWLLDGRKARVTNGGLGMEFHAGPVEGENASHAVLWTRDSFEGDIKVEYTYTRLDKAVRHVILLYLLATGSGQGGYGKDIASWSEQRAVPKMSLYYKHMNLYHISYAAFGPKNRDPLEDYVRARRYMSEPGRLRGTELSPGYSRTGLFQTGVPHKMTVIKAGDDLFMRVEARDRGKLFHWKTSSHPPLSEGRIGLRHMWTRAARYRDFRVSVLTR